jgi:YT521-B-like domain
MPRTSFLEESQRNSTTNTMLSLLRISLMSITPKVHPLLMPKPDLTLIENTLLMDYTFVNEFQRLEDYSNLTLVKRTFPPLRKVNTLKYESQDLSVNAFYVLIKATIYDDIQKCMKYGFWTSSIDTNRMISAIYTQAQEEGKEVFLIMGTNCDTNCYGIARLNSNLIRDQYHLWWQNIKYKGTFEVEWLHVKTINLATINIKEENCGIHELPDGSEINTYSGQKIMRIFEKASKKGNIFDLFPILDMREDRLINMRKSQGVEIKLTKISQP